MALPLPRVHAQTGGQGKIEGQIVNGTKDAPASSVASASVTLYMATRGATTMITQTTTSDANGQFVFTSLETISTTRYLAIAEYAGIEYYSDVLTFPENAATVPAEITIYETTTEPSAIQVDQLHLIFGVQGREFNVLQIIVLQNTGDRMYIGAPPQRATMTLPLLAGAADVQFVNPDAEATTLRGDGVLTYTLPIAPGEDQIVYGYALPFTPPTYQLNFKLPFATEKFSVLLADVGGTIQSQQLSEAPSLQAPNGQNFLVSSATNLAAGTVVNATFANLPGAASAPAPIPSAPTGVNSTLISGIALTVVALAAIALLAYPLLKRRSKGAKYLANRRARLLQEIAALDDALEAEEISEAEHREKRAALKAKLAEMGDAE